MKLSVLLIPILILGLWGSVSFASERSNDGIAGAGAQYCGAAAERK